MFLNETDKFKFNLTLDLKKAKLTHKFSINFQEYKYSNK